MSEDTGEFKQKHDRSELSPDLAQTTTSDDKTADFIVRVEWGTIQPFYLWIAALASPEGNLAEQWSGRLLYNFSVGVSIGNTQGSFRSGNCYQQSLQLHHPRGNCDDGKEAELILVEEAVERDYYPDDFDEDDFARLEGVFPQGVAEYEEPCMGMPHDVRVLLGLQ